MHRQIQDLLVWHIFFTHPSASLSQHSQHTSGKKKKVTHTSYPTYLADPKLPQPAHRSLHHGFAPKRPAPTLASIIQKARIRPHGRNTAITALAAATARALQLAAMHAQDIHAADPLVAPMRPSLHFARQARNVPGAHFVREWDDFAVVLGGGGGGG